MTQTSIHSKERICDFCNIETEDWVMEVLPGKVMKDYCVECYEKYKGDKNDTRT